jgi:hypothetical protein
MPLPSANFPSSYYSSPQELSTFKDGTNTSANQIATSTLTATYSTSGATTITSAGGGFTNWPAFGIARNGTTTEQIFYSSKDNDNLYVLADGRAQNGTSASAGSIGHVMTFIEVRVTGALVNQLLAEVKALGLGLKQDATPIFAGVQCANSGITNEGTITYNTTTNLFSINVAGTPVVLNPTQTSTVNGIPQGDPSTGKISSTWLNTGSGSDIDADKLDGLDSTAFAAAAHNHTKANITDLETITTTPTASAIPKANGSGKIDNDWLNSSVVTSSGSSPSLKVLVKSGDQTLSSTSKTDITDLTFSVVTSAVYQFKFILFCNVSNGNGLALDIAFSGTASSFRCGVSTTGNTPTLVNAYSSAFNTNFITVTPDGLIFVTLEGQITASATGTLSARAALLAGSSGAIISQASMLYVTKVN